MIKIIRTWFAIRQEKAIIARNTAAMVAMGADPKEVERLGEKRMGRFKQKIH